MNPASSLVFVKRCEWVSDGSRCPSPALRNEPFCLEHCGAAAAGRRPEQARGNEPGRPAPRAEASPRPDDEPYDDAVAPGRAAGGRNGRAQRRDIRELHFGSNLLKSEGRARCAIWLMREYSAGRLERRRFEALLGGVRLVAALIGEPPAAPARRPPTRGKADADAPIVRRGVRRLSKVAATAGASHRQPKTNADRIDSSGPSRAARAAAHRPGLIDRSARRASARQEAPAEPGAAEPSVSDARSKRGSAGAPEERQNR